MKLLSPLFSADFSSLLQEDETMYNFQCTMYNYQVFRFFCLKQTSLFSDLTKNVHQITNVQFSMCNVQFLDVLFFCLKQTLLFSDLTKKRTSKY